MGWFGPSGDCGCCASEFGCDFDVSEITIDSADPCLAPFVGTWATVSSCPVDSCTRDCNDCVVASIISGSCVVGSDTYAATELWLLCYRTNASATVYVKAIFYWRVGLIDTYFLTGRFVSTDNGDTFSTFQIDTQPPGCVSLATSNGPTSGADLTCSITKV